VDNKITTLSRRVCGVAQLLPLEGMVAQWCARATTTNGRDAHFTLDFRRDRQPFDRFEMDSRLLSEFRVPSKVEGDACPTTTNRDRRPFDKLRVPSKVEGDACPTNTLDHGRALTCSHLATSQSHSLTWLSTYHQPAGPSLKLTCRSFGTSRGWPLAIPSAGPVAGAGIAGGDGGAALSLVGTAVPAVRDLGFGGLGTARPTTVDNTRGRLGTLRRRSEQAARPTTSKQTGETPVSLWQTGTGKMPVSRQQTATGETPVSLRQTGTGKMPVLLFPAGNRRQPEVWIA